MECGQTRQPFKMYQVGGSACIILLSHIREAASESPHVARSQVRTIRLQGPHFIADVKCCLNGFDESLFIYFCWTERLQNYPEPVRTSHPEWQTADV